VALSRSHAVASVTQTLERTWRVLATLIAGNYRYEVRAPNSTASVQG
jgi:hypothetical protein